MNRKDFELAVRAAPEWTRDALKTINTLEETIEAGMRYIQANKAPGYTGEGFKSDKGYQDIPNVLDDSDMYRLHKGSICWDDWYTSVSPEEIDKIHSIFSLLMSLRKDVNPKQPDYIYDAFDCDDTASMYRAAAKFISTDKVNPAVGMAVLDNDEGAHMAIAVVGRNGKLFILDPMLSYYDGKPVLFNYSKVITYPDGVKFTVERIYW